MGADAIDGSYSMIQVEDAFGEFHQIKRKTGSWVNWGIFYQVWVKVREVGKWQQGDYVVKADADAVLVPQRLRDWKFGPWGEDVFMQRCLDHHYVDKVEAWDLTTDGACEADRPEGEKKNKKWHAPDCSAVTTPAAHPFKKPDDYMKCMSGMTGQQLVA